MLSLFPSGSRFAPGARPEFQVDVVNVGGATCSFDAGSRSFHLVVKSGADRIWSSADCSRGPSSAARRLRRGVPYTVSFSWSRMRSSPGCRGARPAARPGTYTAIAYGGGAASSTAVFTLR